ncbi:UDP-glucose 4-epimerase [Gammaproteobacteria bacterium MOLA455]|nr:UDP-glucose 4-epimerase [Gammaproteobacteria bacterium MOLA455]
MVKNKILVTGGAGFIGSNLCFQLAKNPQNEVYSLDNYSTGSKENHITGVHYLEGEVKDISALIDFNPDYIYHLGEYSRVEQSFEDLDKVWESNNGGMFPMLKFVIKTGAKLIYAGSSTKFGDGGIGRNQSPYAWTKATNTELILNFAAWFNIRISIVYFYNAYGNNEISYGKYATLIALFSRAIRAGKPLTVVSPGTQERNFTHVDDIVDGLILVGENGNGDGYGIGSPDTYTVLDVANLFDGEIEMLPARKGNRMHAELVTEKTKKLGWEPKRKLKDYIAGIRLES